MRIKLKVRPPWVGCFLMRDISKIMEIIFFLFFTFFGRGMAIFFGKPRKIEKKLNFACFQSDTKARCFGNKISNPV